MTGTALRGMLGVTRAGTDSRPDGARHEPPHDGRPGSRLVVAPTTRHADRIRSPLLAGPGGRSRAARHGASSPTAVGREPAPEAAVRSLCPGSRGTSRGLGDAYLCAASRPTTATASEAAARKRRLAQLSVSPVGRSPPVTDWSTRLSGRGWRHSCSIRCAFRNNGENPANASADDC